MSLLWLTVLSNGDQKHITKVKVDTMYLKTDERMYINFNLWNNTKWSQNIGISQKNSLIFLNFLKYLLLSDVWYNIHKYIFV